MKQLCHFSPTGKYFSSPRGFKQRVTWRVQTENAHFTRAERHSRIWTWEQSRPDEVQPRKLEMWKTILPTRIGGESLKHQGGERYRGGAERTPFLYAAPGPQWILPRTVSLPLTAARRITPELSPYWSLTCINQPLSALHSPSLCFYYSHIVWLYLSRTMAIKGAFLALLVRANH